MYRLKSVKSYTLTPLISLLLFTLSDPKAITAELGQDITLKCRAPNNNILAGVEWSRPDLEPEYVLLLRDGHFIPEDQQSSFKNRVDLQDKQMKGGDVSLILKNVTGADAGTYECRVLTQGGKRRKRAVETIRVIHLSVVDPPGE
uniref:Ig-like domain-containing protein n=1 Tax=Haplochromis burtoni TaxID=8153 RepID=A0A3Q2WG81_HAPBU